jgi:hypothetical protein
MEFRDLHTVNKQLISDPPYINISNVQSKLNERRVYIQTEEKDCT